LPKASERANVRLNEGKPLICFKSSRSCRRYLVMGYFN